MADDPNTELREAYRQPPKPTDCSWEHQAKNPKTGKRRDRQQDDWNDIMEIRNIDQRREAFFNTWNKPKLNKYGEPKLYLNELDVIELKFALDMFRDIYINNIHNMKYKEKMREAHWYIDYALLICKNAAKGETERRYNEWKTHEIQQDSGKKPHEYEHREGRGWYK